ncbi:prolyl oligopeptidase family serine peptidase [Tenacibaculum sp.]|nr:prolyl oligopeptidase family serine peptidase [Tenacibaculum sp.]
MNKILNHTIKRKFNKPIVLDAFYKENNEQKAVIIFCHGYKGFKDWGAWNLMAEAFAKADFVFVKFNFSHNGGSVNQPIDFPDLEAFGENNYSKELDDLAAVIDWVCENGKLSREIDTSNISLIGHSRGGGIVVIKSEEDARINNVITLAGVSDYKSRFPKKEAFEKWKEKGVYYVKNGRTKQEMPHFYQFYKDFEKNEKRLTIKRAVQKLKIPHLIIHGDKDTSVPIEEGLMQHKWNQKSKFISIKETNHVFGISHLWNKDKMSIHLEKVVDLCVNFLKK